MRALVVDDSRALRTILCSNLAAEGFEVTEASNGRQAMAALDEVEIDVALVDWNVPGVGGHEIVRTMRGRRDMDETAIIVVTSDRNGFDAESALSAGADDCVLKPFTAATLRRRLESLGLLGPALAAAI